MHLKITPLIKSALAVTHDPQLHCGVRRGSAMPPSFRKISENEGLEMPLRDDRTHSNPTFQQNSADIPHSDTTHTDML